MDAIRASLRAIDDASSIPCPLGRLDAVLIGIGLDVPDLLSIFCYLRSNDILTLEFQKGMVSLRIELRL